VRYRRADLRGCFLATRTDRARRIATRTFNPTFPSGFTIGRSRCVEPATPMALFPARRGVRGAGRGARKYRTLGLLEDDEREHRL